jgi:hypothetical protein
LGAATSARGEPANLLRRAVGVRPARGTTAAATAVRRRARTGCDGRRRGNHPGEEEGFHGQSGHAREMPPEGGAARTPSRAARRSACGRMQPLRPFERALSRKSRRRRSGLGLAARLRGGSPCVFS